MLLVEIVLLHAYVRACDNVSKSRHIVSILLHVCVLAVVRSMCCTTRVVGSQMLQLVVFVFSTASAYAYQTFQPVVRDVRCVRTYRLRTITVV